MHPQYDSSGVRLSSPGLPTVHRASLRPASPADAYGGTVAANASHGRGGRGGSGNGHRAPSDSLWVRRRNPHADRAGVILFRGGGAGDVCAAVAPALLRRVAGGL